MRPRELRVVLDTNAVFTKTPTHLLSHDVANLIQSTVGQQGPALKWFLPETVYGERRFQMLARGDSLLAHLRTAQDILGRSLSVTKEDMEKAIEELLKAQVETFQLTVAPIDLTKVNWAALVDAAHRRIPPFEKNNEKGFRDALILECFIQVIDNSPTNSNLCRLALVTKDELLGLAATQRTDGVLNARVLNSLEDLKGYITTLEKEVPEALVDTLKPIAATFFYVEDDSSCLYSQANVKKRIKEDHAEKLAEVPYGARSRENVGWRVDPPRFVDSNQRTLTWASRVIVEAIATKLPNQWPSNLYSSDYTLNQPSTLYSTAFTVPPAQLFSSDYTVRYYKSLLPSSGSTQIPGATKMFSDTPDESAFRHAVLGTFPGRSIFEVTWSATVTDDSSLTDAKVISIQFIETVWE